MRINSNCTLTIDSDNALGINSNQALRVGSDDTFRISELELTSHTLGADDKAASKA